MNTVTSAVTLADVEQAYGVSHLDHLDRQAEIPVVSRLAFQGDVAIIRREGRAPARTPIPADGFPVVRGENGGNTHAVFGAGYYDAFTTPDSSNLILGTLFVPDGGQVLMSHPEHGGFLVEPGIYEIRRQREQADEIRLVQD